MISTQSASNGEASKAPESAPTASERAEKRANKPSPEEEALKAWFEAQEQHQKKEGKAEKKESPFDCSKALTEAFDCLSPSVWAKSYYISGVIPPCGVLFGEWLRCMQCSVAYRKDPNALKEYEDGKPKPHVVEHLWELKDKPSLAPWRAPSDPLWGKASRPAADLDIPAEKS
eukprot:tig00021123_g18490.t1